MFQYAVGTLGLRLVKYCIFGIIFFSFQGKVVCTVSVN
jgi:hypothetical protein